MDWTPLTEADFVRHVQTMETSHEPGTSSQSRLIGELLDELVTNGQAWSEPALIDLLSGRWGVTSRIAAARSIESGFKEGGSICSFTRMCIRHNRMALLSAVANLGLPQGILNEESLAPYTQAVTDSGRWLDILANVGESPRTTFARQVGAYANSNAGTLLADILVRHDPAHASIEDLQGEPGYAVFSEALMRRHIEMATPGSTAAATTGGTRRRRASL